MTNLPASLSTSNPNPNIRWPPYTLWISLSQNNNNLCSPARNSTSTYPTKARLIWNLMLLRLQNQSVPFPQTLAQTSISNNSIDHKQLLQKSTYKTLIFTLSFTIKPNLKLLSEAEVDSHLETVICLFPWTAYWNLALRQWIRQLSIWYLSVSKHFQVKSLKKLAAARSKSFR